tara:strand:- start:715 stop:1119 length:405 start_codon:yes stop_codon:yes gene_type:complete
MINILKLNKMRDRKNMNKEFIFKRVLKKIHTKIENTSERGFAQAIYIIPKVILGLPAYNQLKCAAYCVNKLKANGFLVVYTYPNMIFISWSHVPSTLVNPQYKMIAYQILTQPEKDFSSIIQQISNYDNKQLEY